jgi:hypothetical protein
MHYVSFQDVCATYRRRDLRGMIVYVHKMCVDVSLCSSDMYHGVGVCEDDFCLQCSNGTQYCPSVARENAILLYLFERINL